MQQHLPAEWHPQYAIQLTWPHEHTDWQWILEEVQAFYLSLAKIILKHQNVIICVPNEHYKNTISNALEKHSDHYNLHIYVCPSNDTWARDHGPITVFKNGQPHILDYQFNGWGNKFESQLDNQISQNLFHANAYNALSIETKPLVLEGGSIESDGLGTLLTTEKCLLNNNRNPELSKQEIEQQLKTDFGTDTILWLQHGDLEGDDTDAHIDTLARLAPNNTLIFQGCQNPQDPHFSELSKMKSELQRFKNAQDQSFTLFELPMPQAIYEDGQRLPATYANFLFINGAVLLPIYNVPEDQLAIDTMKSALPLHTIIPVDCSVLIRQYGSLHCITMQIPDTSDAL